MFRQGLAQSPAHLYLHTSFASMLQGMGRIPEALDVLAELHVEAGDADAALELLDSRPGLTERVAATERIRSRVLERLGRHTEVREAFGT